MHDQIISQLEFIRGNTLRAVQNLQEKDIDLIPEGFSNNIRWNLGHIYVVSERFAFFHTPELMEMPNSFPSLFANGTSPADWQNNVPSLEELVLLLQQQPGRIKEGVGHRFDEKLSTPYQTQSGLSIHTIGECVNFSLYHEGMHFSTIKHLKRFI